MRKCLSMILGIGLLMVFTPALAEANAFCDEIPPAVIQLELLDNPDAVFSDCIVIEGTPQGNYCFVLSPWRLNGYLLENGAWKRTTQVGPMPQEDSAFLFFRRHAKDSDVQNAPVNNFTDDLGFDIVRSNSKNEAAYADVIQYHWLDDGDFRIVGWQSMKSPEYAVWQDGQWLFFNRSTGETLGSVRNDYLYEYGVMIDFTSLPHTLEQARSMEAISRPLAETLFPGWTLSSYSAYNTGHAAAARYYRIADGMLTIRRASLSSEKGIDSQTDTMPVPLSDELLARMQAEDVIALIDTSGDGNTFLTDDSFDRKRIPVSGTVLANDMQTNGLLLLTEDENGIRRVCWVEEAGNSYSIHTSNPLPQDAYFDLFHVADDGVIVQWGGQSQSCGFTRTADGNWMLRWMMGSGKGIGVLSTLYCGVTTENMITFNDIVIGSHPWQNLFSIDFSKFPNSNEEIIAVLERDGWAVVNNSVETDRLHLRTRPDRASASLGKFYNRTPVEVLEQQGDWTRVRIGLDGHLEGWMMTRYLAFGAAMDNVASAMPAKVLNETPVNPPLYTSTSMNETANVTLSSSYYWIIGVVEDELYILLDASGNTGYMPQAWFWDGNG